MKVMRISLHICISLHFSTLLYISLNFSTFLFISACLCISLHFIAFLWVSLHFLHFSSLLYISLHFSTFLCLSLHFNDFIFIYLHCIPLHFSTFYILYFRTIWRPMDANFLHNIVIQRSVGPDKSLLRPFLVQCYVWALDQLTILPPIVESQSKHFPFLAMQLLRFTYQSNAHSHLYNHPNCGGTCVRWMTNELVMGE